VIRCLRLANPLLRLTKGVFEATIKFPQNASQPGSAAPVAWCSDFMWLVNLTPLPPQSWTERCWYFVQAIETIVATR